MISKIILILTTIFILASCGKSNESSVSSEYNKYYSGENESQLTVEDSDTKKIGDNYFSKGASVYSRRFGGQGILVEGADLSTFIALKNHKYDKFQSGYGKDNDSVFYYGLKVEGADSSSFEVNGHLYGKDKNLVYYGAEKVLMANVGTFESLTNDSILDIKIYDYGKDEMNVFYKGKQIIGADSNSFEQLSNLYARDMKNVYFEGKKLDKADPGTIEVLSFTYAKDKNSVFDYEGVVEGIDAKSFRRYDESDYFSDKNGVYFTRELFTKVEGADVASFTALMNGYAKDRNNIYNQHIILRNFDLETFQVLTDTQGWSADRKPIYLKDKNRVSISNFFEIGANIVFGADAESFQLLKDGYYAKDKNGIYWDSQQISGVDYDSFEVVGDNLAKDRNNEFINGELVR